MPAQTIEVEATTQPADPPAGNQTQALAVRPQGGAIGRALTVQELHERLEFVRKVMKQEMKVDQDYGKIPGTGDKPSLLQPGAQKLLMTFNLREQVKKETLRQFDNLPIFGHREYELTVTVFPSGDRPENGWDGVGTCSTLESKYRYRKAERKCPQCHKPHIISGKEEYGGGFLCWKKRGGCGAKFDADDQRILSQPAEDVENDDPADCWNTCRKMAFKRALVAAAINATNTSELWTQDVEDMAANERNRPKPAAASSAATTAQPQGQTQRASQAASSGKPATQEAGARVATPKTREWMISKIPGPMMQTALQFLIEVGWLMPNEGLKDLPLRYTPVTSKQLDSLLNCIGNFGSGHPAARPYEMNPEPEAEKAKGKAKPKEAAAAPAAPAAPAGRQDPEWWRGIICPVPPKGVKRTEYMKAPDTIGGMYDRMKEGDNEAQRRLWGFVHNYDPKPWTGSDGKERQPSQADKVFREALDAFADWHEKNGKDTPAAAEAPPSSEPWPEDEEQPY